MIRDAPAPIIRTDMVMPFVRRLETLGGSGDELLAAVGVDRRMLRTDGFVPVASWYRFTELCAERTGDIHFGFRVGAESAAEALPNLRGVVQPALSLGDVVNRLIADAKRHANLGHYVLSNDGEQVVLRLQRHVVPDARPAQIDAFGFGFFIRILRLKVGRDFDPAGLAVRLSEPSAVPPDSRSGMQVVPGNNAGPVYTFPADWLLCGAGTSREADAAGRKIVSNDFVASVREIIRQRLHDPDLDEKSVAQISGRSVRSLQWGLMKAGTTYRRELTDLRMAMALDLLTDTDLGISDIAVRLGYRDTTGFIRAFRSWTGQTPGRYRRAQPGR